MKKLIKKAFTLVELLVVIAILAALATVGIVSFGAYTKKANTAKDETIISQLQHHTEAYKALDNKVNVPSDVKDNLADNGFNIDTLKAASTGSYFAFDLTKQNFEYFNEEEKAAIAVEDRANYLLLSKEVNNEGFGTYLQKGFAGNEVVTSASLDVGSITYINNIFYKNTGAQNDNVLLRTAGNMCSVTVYAPNDHVEHYGYAKEVNVASVNKTASYHEFGTVKDLNVTSGKVVIENVGVVFNMNEVAYVGDANKNIPAVTIPVDNNITNKGGNVMASTVASVVATETFEINNLAQLEAFRDATNSGETFLGKTINLNSDITLNGAWTPISNYYRKDKNDNKGSISYGDFDLSQVAFQGTFNGNNHTIIGLTNEGVSANKINTGYNSTTPAGQTEYVYGFFATVYNATIKNLYFSNVKIVNVDGLLGDGSAACVGYANGVTINNVKVLSGSISGYDDVAGILGMARKATCKIDNCENNATISATRRAAGILAQYGSGVGDQSYVKNCVNKGAITCVGETINTTEQDVYNRYFVAGIVLANSGAKGYFYESGNTNSGLISINVTINHDETTHKHDACGSDKTANDCQSDKGDYSHAYQISNYNSK